jgi:transcription initiation factor TFIID subunit 6
MIGHLVIANTPVGGAIRAMSVFPRENVRVAAEAMGIASLSDEVAQVHACGPARCGGSVCAELGGVGQAVAGDLEYRLREIVQEAAKFTRHSRRKRLTTDDINSALRARNIEV